MRNGETEKRDFVQIQGPSNADHINSSGILRVIMHTLVLLMPMISHDAKIDK